MKQKFLLVFTMALLLCSNIWAADNNALNFDGTDDYVDCGAISLTTFTASAWVNPSTVSIDQAIISTLSTSSTTGFELHLGTDGIPVLTIRGSSSWTDIKGSATIKSDKWTHLTVSYDGTTASIYINDTLQASSDVTASLGSEDLTIGRRSQGNYYFDGTIDEVGIWSSALSQEEIRDVIQDGLTGSETNIVAAYTFNQGTSAEESAQDNTSETTLDDASSSGYSGTLYNFTLTDLTSNWVDGYDADYAETALFLTTSELTISRLSGSTDDFTFYASNSNTWTITNSASWLTLSSLTGTGDATITVTTSEENTTGESHEATLSITVGNLIKTVTVTQAPLAGNGTESDPFQVSTLSELESISNNTDLWTGNYFFIQTADIDASETSAWNSEQGFSPIGSDDIQFTGSYNGQGHTITGLTINRSTTARIALFGYTDGATISNLGVTDCSIKGGDHTGALIGTCVGGSTISQCYSTGSVSGGQYSGGFMGYNYNGSTVSDSYSTCSVESSSTAVGGFAGRNNGAIFENCYSTGAVSGSSPVGGMIGYVTGSATVSNCYYNTETSDQSTGIGSGSGSVTGLTTEAMQTLSSFESWDFATLTSDGTDDIWTIASATNNGYPVLSWQINTTSFPSFNDVTVSANATIGTLSCSMTDLGEPNPVAYGFCYSTSVETHEIGTDGCDTTCLGALNGNKTATLAFDDQISGLEMGTTFYIRAYAINAKGTVYSDVTNYTKTETKAVRPTGMGTEDSPYQIATLPNLRWLSESPAYWSSYFIQTADIDASETSIWNDGSGFTPIGTDSNTPFTGTYNGNAHTISSLTHSSSDNNIALFGYTTGATISNLGVTDVDFSGAEGVAGLVNCAEATKISACYSTGSIASSAATAGGLVGYTTNSSMISNCYSTCSVSGGNKTGGLVGLNKESSTVEYCYSTGEVTSSSSTAGDFVGENRSGNTVAYCFYNSDTGNLAKLVGTDNGTSTSCSGLTTTQMQTLSSFENWDFAALTTDGTDEIWTIASSTNTGYPVLTWQIEETSSPAVDDVTATVSSTTASLSCSITDLGISNPVAYGFCYSSSVETPVIGTHGCITTSLEAVNGNETASLAFEDEISDLETGTTYYIRAYATNINGTVYSSNVTSIMGPETVAVQPSGEGTTSSPYIIANLANLRWVSENSDSWGGVFKQTADIDATETSSWNSNAGFKPIGTLNDPVFSGTYDGNEHIISNLYINRTSTRMVGLFGDASGCTIKDLGVVNCNITAWYGTGAIVGRTDYEDEITGCFSSGKVRSTTANGTGGIVGWNYGTITNCYSRANVTGGNLYVGGIAGESYGNISYCYATGYVNGPTGYEGGIVAHSSSSLVSDCYYDSQTTGQDDTGKGSPLTTSNMKLSSQLSGFDFETVWAISTGTNDGYPIFIWQMDEISAPELGEASALIDADNTSVATLHCSFSSLGVSNPSAYGFCYSTTNSTPTTSDSNIDQGEVSGEDDADAATDDFTVESSDIMDGDTYYIRAYATNITGTVYSEYVEFTYSNTPAVSWTSPDAITYGTALSSTQLNATATYNSSDVAGSFTYTLEDGTAIADGTTLDVGTYSVSLTFVPSGTGYNTVNKTDAYTITVNKADPVISWDNPSAITYGTTLGDNQLNATCNIEGTFTYSPAAGTTIDAGDNQTLSVSFTPSDENNYNTASASVTITVDKVDPIISWTNPKDITYGTALNVEQLNASADLEGTFTYSPAASEILNAGDDQTLELTFTPYNTNYNAATSTVSLNVNKATLTVTADDQTVEQGEDLPELTISYSGFVNGEDENVLATPPTASTSVTNTSVTGTYDITASGGSDTNYDFTYVKGKLTISVPTGISDVTEEGLKVYPNPATDIIYIDGAEGIVSLYNIAGKKVLTHDLSNGNSIDISNLDNGIYILNVEGKNVKIIIGQ